jgi:hypothetical protein
MRKFSGGPRPVKAYDKIMQKILSTVSDSLNFLTSDYIEQNQLELGQPSQKAGIPAPL